MKYKEFKRWCNERQCDGCWGMVNPANCVSIMRELEKIPFWRRHKEWNTKYKNEIMNQITKERSDENG